MGFGIQAGKQDSHGGGAHSKYVQAGQGPPTNAQLGQPSTPTSGCVNLRSLLRVMLEQAGTAV